MFQFLPNTLKNESEFIIKDANINNYYYSENKYLTILHGNDINVQFSRSDLENQKLSNF